MPGDHPRATMARAAWLTTLALAGGLVMAGPMIWSELDDFGYAAAVRVVVGLVCGGLGAPMLVVAVWRKPTGRAMASIYGPPAAAAVLAALSWSDDYSFTHVAVPLSYVTVLITFLVVPDRDDSDGGRRCPTCGYDLRTNPAGRCPECGAATPAPVTTSERRWRALRRAALLLAAMAVSGTLHTIFLRGLLSLG